MAPALLDAQEHALLTGYAQKIKEWQGDNSLSFAQLLKKLPQIGSDRTFNKILRGDFTELNIETQLAEYAAAVAFIEQMAGSETDEQDWDDGMSTALELRRKFGRMQGTRTIARCGWVIAPTGAGKTGARIVLMKKYGSKLVPLSANVLWGDNPRVFARELLKATGHKTIPVTAAEVYAKLIEILSNREICFLIEEAHHLGPNCLDLIKVVINDSDASFVLFAIDTLWAKLERAAYAQAAQLKGNRFAFKIRITTEMMKRDALRMVERRVKLDPGVLDAETRKHLLEQMLKHGRLAFVREFLRKLKRLAGHEPANREQWIAAITEEIEERNEETRGGAQ
jgi:hypothetical protein